MESIQVEGQRNNAPPTLRNLKPKTPNRVTDKRRREYILELYSLC